jgi:hypothetical protein
MSQCSAPGSTVDRLPARKARPDLRRSSPKEKTLKLFARFPRFLLLILARFPLIHSHPFVAWRRRELIDQGAPFLLLPALLARCWRLPALAPQQCRRRSSRDFGISMVIGGSQRTKDQWGLHPTGRVASMNTEQPPMTLRAGHSDNCSSIAVYPLVS